MAARETLGFVGLGNMGSRMAGHLLRAGHDLTIFDLDSRAVAGLEKQGARSSGSVAEVALTADVTFSALPGPREVEKVALGPEGIVENARSGSVYVDLSTNSPEVIRAIADRAVAHDVGVLDAAMSGGMHGAATRRLSLMVGGDRAVFERVQPLLETMSDNVVYCGGSGAGTATKIVNNLISLTESALAGEAIALGMKWGVDLDTLVAVIGKSSGSSWRLTESFPRYLLAGNFKPGFALDLAVKDLALAKELAGAAGVTADFLDLSLGKYREAQDRGYGQQHSEAVVRLIEEEWGVELRSSGRGVDGGDA